MNLYELERKYGGVERVKRRAVSPHDPRIRKARVVEAIPGSMLSGARFLPRTGYADMYSRHLDKSGRFVMVELGILLGVGLAVWSDVFPEARIIGLDVDTSLFAKEELEARGAFRSNRPEVHFLDELGRCATMRLERILKGEKIDVMIDDALHDDNSILRALEIFLPFMADGFVYFIEDNGTVDQAVRDTYPHLSVERTGRLTVVKHEA